VIYQIKPYFEKKTLKDVKKYLDSGKWITEHHETKKFEKKFASFVGAKHCITYPNGTLTMIAMLDCLGIKDQDEVLVSNYTMIATANVAKIFKAKPVLVDISRENFCMSPIDLKKKLTRKSKFCIYTSINGRLGDIEKIKNICKKNKIIFLEDAAHSIGSYKNNKHAGTFGLGGSFSFSMPKLITMGQGGAIVTNNDSFAKQLRLYKDFGRRKSGEDIHDNLGYNGKITDLQSVLGLGQLKNIKKRISIKKNIYKIYHKLLHKNKNIVILKPNKEETNWSVDIYLKNSIQLKKKLKKNKILTRFVYPPIGFQKIYNIKNNLEVSNFFCKRGLWLPSSLDLKASQIKKICKLINDFVK
jgi:perosamine synthetase